MEKAVENGSGSGDIADELAPFFQWSIAGHDGRSVLVAPENDFQQVFARLLGRRPHAHVVDHQQIGFEIPTQCPVLLVECVVSEEVPDQVEDGAVEDLKVHFNGFIGNGLSEMCFTTLALR